MFVELQGPLESSIESTNIHALNLLSRVLEGFSLHPFFFILNLNLKNHIDPPVHPFAHQLELLYRLALRKPIRILIADEIGLGKTIEAVLVTKLLEEKDGVKRILLLVPRILVEQWKSELKRFGIHAKVIERKNISRLGSQGFHDGWYIASIDLVKRDEHRQFINRVDWDVIVVDEAHRVGRVGVGQRSITQRYELVEELASNTSRNIILLTATPHRGNALDYNSRLKLVDPYLIGEKELDNDFFYKLTRDSIVVRRTKMDVNRVYERREVFKSARFIARVIGATEEEIRFNELLFEFLRDKLERYYEYLGDEPRAIHLLLALVAKRASSSPYAAMRTLEKMLRRRSLVLEGKATTLLEASKLDEEAESIVEAYLGVGFEDYSEIGDLEEAVEPDEVLNEFVEKCSVLLEDQDVEKLKRLLDLSKTIIEKGDSRLQGVFKLIQEHNSKGDKIVVFTEYKDTAEYIYNKLKEELPEVFNTTALVTSNRIIIPGWRGREEPSIEDLKRYLRLGHVKLIISTDVASEGLNLQAANIIVNYEPTWSPIKIEQRLGRVWRLGQEREVVSYTVFLATKSDRDVLEVLYKKLLAWGRSLQESRVAIGEEVEIDMRTEEGYTTIPVEEARATPKYSEFKALLEYIRGGRDGLEKYVQSIINALKSLKDDLERIGLSRRNIEFKIERLLRDVLGDFRGSEIENTMRELLLLVAKLKGFNPMVDENKVFVGGYIVDDLNGYYRAVISLLQESIKVNEPVYIVSSMHLEDLKELHLFKTTILFKDKPVYSESVGVGIRSDSTTVLIRGRKLLDIIIRALSPNHILGVAKTYNTRDLQYLMLKAKTNVINTIVREAVYELITYITHTENRGFARKHDNWEPRDTTQYSEKSEYLGAIIFTQSIANIPILGEIEKAREILEVAAEYEKRLEEPPEDIKRKVEEIAVEIVMKVEREEGRIPRRMPEYMPYDIESIDPNTGEIRIIEVKGHSSTQVHAELTENEYKVAEREKDRYWLYIVYDIKTRTPKILRFQNPLETMNIEIIEKRRMEKRFILRPRKV